MIGNCSGSDQCCVDGLTDDCGLFASTSSAPDAQDNDVVRRDDPNACNERIAASVLDDHRRSFSMKVVDFTLRDNQCHHKHCGDTNAREFNEPGDDRVQPAFVETGKNRP